MNFIDRYREDIEKAMNNIDIPDEEMQEKLKDAIAHAIMLQPKTQTEMRRETKENLMFIADLYVDMAELFLDRLKGKLPYAKTVELIKEYYKTIAEVIH